MYLLESILVSIVLVQFFYYFYFFSRLSFPLESVTRQKKDIPVSVIICAKNESANLQEFLPHIITQDYPCFEIILVNDHSTDDTLVIMQSFAKENNNISVLSLDTNATGNKKKAITQGIKIAKYQHLLFTDADCKPNSTHWISEMTQLFSSKKKIILGYGAHQKIQKSWLNKLIRFETLLTAIQYFSYAKANLAYMGVGRNLAYTKDLFTQANGFTKHQHIKSGDDDLFVNQVVQNNNVACAISSSSFTSSKPHRNFSQWVYQKRRHIATANSYKSLHQFLLGLFYLSQVSFWFLGIGLLFSGNNLSIVISLILVRILAQYFVFGFAAKKLKETDLIIYLPFLELILIITQAYIFIRNLFSKPTKWQK